MIASRVSSFEIKGVFLLKIAWFFYSVSMLCLQETVESNPMIALLSRLGAFVIALLLEMGRMLIFFVSALGWVFRRPLKLRLILYHMKTIGSDSTLVILLTGGFTGMVLALQGYHALKKFSAEGYLGSAVALSLIRELGPVLSAFMVTGRTGSAMAAEIGTMRVTEQIDALYSMALHPIKYLVSPRLVAGLLTMPLLVAVFDVTGIYGGYLTGVVLLGVSAGSYFSSMEANVVMWDITTGIVKSLSFGLIVTWVCCFKGFHAPPMAVGVSKATTESVVLSFVLILVWDYFLTSVMF
jgi:phospholipid/cholesterol/gamma-HCH transport system permease protein